MTLGNNYYIRRSEHSFVHGRPNKLFYLPKIDHADQCFQDNLDDLDEMIEYVNDQIEKTDDLYGEYFRYLTN